MSTSASWWDRVVVPRAVHRFLDSAPLLALRAELVADVSGEVVELGFGSGLSLGAYPTTVTRVLAVDPDDTGWAMSAQARQRAAAAGIEVDRVARDAAALPMRDSSVDTIVAFWTLCTVPDLDAALGEAARVLRSGGRFIFAEHGPSSRPGRRRVEHLVEPVWRPLAGGCHLTREPWLRVPDYGFTLTSDTRPPRAAAAPPGTHLVSAVKGSNNAPAM